MCWFRLPAAPREPLMAKSNAPYCSPVGAVGAPLLHSCIVDPGAPPETAERSDSGVTVRSPVRIPCRSYPGGPLGLYMELGECGDDVRAG